MTELLVLVALILAVASALPPSHISRAVRHPLLIGTLIWAVAHLFVNGEVGDDGPVRRLPGLGGRRPRRPGIAAGEAESAGLHGDSISSRSSSARCVYGASGVAGASLAFRRQPDRLSAQGTPVNPCLRRLKSRRITANDIRVRKGGEPIVALTSYHAHTARIIDPFVDFILVGDSLGMVMHGLETTLPVTLDMMILQGRAVMRGASHCLVVVDLPFGSYEESPVKAFRSAARVLKETGCGAVKLEGGSRMAETVRFLVERGVPVMGHVGLTPQAVNTIGGFKVQGRDPAGGRVDPGRRQGDRRGRRLRRGGRGGGRAAGPRDHRGDSGADHRHRRLAGLRRPDPGAGGHARPQPLGAEIRQALRQSGRADRGIGRAYADEVRDRTFPADDNVYKAEEIAAAAG